MHFAMKIDKNDYGLITDVHNIIGDFYVAARRYVALNPQLKAAIDNVENKSVSDEKILTAVTNMKFSLAERLLTEEFSQETPEQQADIIKELEIQCVIVEAQAFDHFIGVLERFSSAAAISKYILPAKAKEYPLAYATTMEKYGMKRSAAAVLYNWSLQQG